MTPDRHIRANAITAEPGQGETVRVGDERIAALSHRLAQLKDLVERVTETSEAMETRLLGTGPADGSKGQQVGQGGAVGVCETKADELQEAIAVLDASIRRLNAAL